MKKLVLYISLFALPHLVLAGNNDPAKDNKKTGKDTTKAKAALTPLIAAEEIESFDEMDNLFAEDGESENVFLRDPGFDTYGIWDTISVNPYHIDLTKKEDTTFINLQDHHHCDYYHPYAGHITSDFGPRSRYRYHYGVDIDLETGDSVFCAFEGTVRIARKSPSYGNVVVVRHKNGLETLYAHLSKMNVQIGQHVEPGEMLGLGGNTGRSRGSHLHFEVRYKGMPINPNQVINFQNSSLTADTLAISKHSFNYIKEFKSQKGKGRYYKVRPGDTLSSIARRNRTSVSKLRKLNNMSSKSVLKAGKRIRIA